MELSKKVAYLKGLMEGLKIDDSTNEGKILTIMADILDEMSATVEDIAEEVDETVELVDTLDEDLGEIDDSVIELRDKFGLPGMKILQFAFENPNENDFLPHNYTPNCVCYTGTHDNDTTLGWYTQAYEASKDKLRRYYSTDASDICWVMIRACFSSVANMAIVPMQDVLKLDSWARMNTPGVGEGNWAWRFKASDLGKQLSDRLLETSKLYGRYTPIPEKKDSEEK